MNAKTSDRALRTLAASLLDSGLSPKEMREVSSSLTNDPAFAKRLARLVNSIADELSEQSVPNLLSSELVKPAPVATSPRANAGSFVRLVEIMDLEKKDLIAILRQSLGTISWNPSPKWPRNRVVSDYVRIASPEMIERALAILQERVEPDPYLEGIMRRKAG